MLHLGRYIIFTEILSFVISAMQKHTLSIVLNVQLSNQHFYFKMRRFNLTFVKRMHNDTLENGIGFVILISTRENTFRLNNQ